MAILTIIVEKIGTVLVALGLPAAQANLFALIGIYLLVTVVILLILAVKFFRRRRQMPPSSPPDPER